MPNPATYNWTAIPHDVPGSGLSGWSTRPFGMAVGNNYSPSTNRREPRGCIGGHYDPDAGRKCLNTRDHDPQMSRFTLPDWCGITEPRAADMRGLPLDFAGVAW